MSAFQFIFDVMSIKDVEKYTQNNGAICDVLS